MQLGEMELTMTTFSDFMFPKELAVSKTNFNRILFIGSCLTEHYLRYWKIHRPDIEYDFILYNNLGQFPEKPPRAFADYSLQYVQIPLRSILTDTVVDMARFSKGDFASEVFERACSLLEMMVDKALTYNRESGLLTLVSNFVVPQGRAAPSLGDQYTLKDLSHVVELLNRKLSEILQRFKNAYVADANAIAATIGKGGFLDDTIYFFAHGSTIFPDWPGHENRPGWTAPEPGRIEPVPSLAEILPVTNTDYFDAIFGQIESTYRTVNQIDQVKVVIFDLDNTLWRGQIGDHYVPGGAWPYSDGWPLGIWEAIHHLRARGILVAICSKNDEALVRERWSNAVNPPFLAMEDFVATQINWSPKAENIAIILKQLNLTAKSAVFVDDNPVERAACAEAHPGLRVIGSNPFMTRRILLWSAETQVARLTDESVRREGMIKAQIERDNEAQGQGREAFLMGLGTEVELIAVENENQNEYSRVVELVNKTNQFNTNGKRWQNTELNAFIAAGGQIRAFKVKDRFADYGLVGVVLLTRHEIVQFVMSCRVLGMDVETAVLRQLVDSMRSEDSSMPITGTISETDSNLPCRDLYTRGGFLPEPGQSGVFSAPLGTAMPEIAHVKMKTANLA